MKKAVIFAPFWGHEGHVGNVRVERFVRWLGGDGYGVVIIRAGSKFRISHEAWGSAITVRDPLGIYQDSNPTKRSQQLRKPNKFRRALAYHIFNPDLGVVWSRVAARHSIVQDAVKGATVIISSSPPESAHVGAWALSRRFSIPHIVDMRDGWLDEPLRPLLRKSALRRWREGRIESRVLDDARAIQVTSDVWKTLLCNRLIQLNNKVSVLTNGYPQSLTQLVAAKRDHKAECLILVHAGRFAASDLRRTPERILDVLLECAKKSSLPAVIRLIGPLSSEDQLIIDRYIDPLVALGWRIEHTGVLARDEVLNALTNADGLLLWSASCAAIPSKLFEYIAAKRPILVLAERGSATWRICEPLHQAALMESEPAGFGEGVKRFLSLLGSTEHIATVPDAYSENALKSVFLSTVKRVMRESV